MIFKTNYNIGQSMIDPFTGEYVVVATTDQKRFEKISGEASMTIPGQAMTIQEMLKRVASGLPIDGQRVPLYEGDENMSDDELVGHPDLSTMDIYDRQEYINQQQERLDDLRNKLRRQKIEEQEKAQQRSKSERNKAQEAPQGPTDAQPRAHGTDQYPKKTRGAGAAPRDEAKASEKGDD